MKEVPGKRNGSSIYIHKNFSYNKDNRLNGTFRCSLRRTTACPGLLKKNDHGYVLETKHNHRGNSMVLEIAEMKQNMLAMCRKTLLHPKEIFDEVCRGNPEAAVQLSYTSMKSIMNRERSKGRPPLPKSVGELNEILQHDESLNLIYQGSVTAADNTVAFLFSSKFLLEALAVSKELFVDGLCSVVPKNSQMSQLYTVHIRYMGKGICVVFALCEARTTALYCAIWNKIVELAPELQKNVKFTMSDYEQAGLNALEKFFPTADIRGCWFHFKQAVTRKWKSLGLDEEISELLSMTKLLPLVPGDRFEEAVDILDDIGINDSNDPDTVFRFLKYVRSTWLPLASKVSVYKCRLRTNNIVESFNNIAKRKLGGNHPNLWIFLSNLRNFIKDQELDLGRLKNNQAVGRARRRKDIERDAKIFHAQKDLSSGRLPLEQFLRMFHCREWDREDVDETQDNDDNQTEVMDCDDLPEGIECEVIIAENVKSSGHGCNRDDGDATEDNDDNQVTDCDDALERIECEVNIVEKVNSLDQNAGINTFEGNKQDAPLLVLAERNNSNKENIENSAVGNTKDFVNKGIAVGKNYSCDKRIPVVVLKRLGENNALKRNIDSVPIVKGFDNDGLVPSKRKPLPGRQVPKRTIKPPAKYRV